MKKTLRPILLRPEPALGIGPIVTQVKPFRPGKECLKWQETI